MNIKIMNENQTRKAAVILSWILIATAFTAFMVYAVKNYTIEKLNLFQSIKPLAELLAYLIIFLSFPCGIRPTLSLRKPSRRLLYIPVAGWIVFIIWNMGLIMASGWFFLIFDTIKTIMKKPLASEEI